MPQASKAAPETNFTRYEQTENKGTLENRHTQDVGFRRTSQVMIWGKKTSRWRRAISDRRSSRGTLLRQVTVLYVYVL